MLVKIDTFPFLFYNGDGIEKENKTKIHIRTGDKTMQISKKNMIALIFGTVAVIICMVIVVMFSGGFKKDKEDSAVTETSFLNPPENITSSLITPY